MSKDQGGIEGKKKAPTLPEKGPYFRIPRRRHPTLDDFWRQTPRPHPSTKK